MATIKNDGSFSFLTGSSSEGQTYARHMAHQNIQDIDILLHCGIVKSEQNLIRTSVPGFVRIRFNDKIKATAGTTFVEQNDINGIGCLNGFLLKEKHCTRETVISGPSTYVHRSGQTSSDASSAAATQTLTYETIDIGKQFHTALLNIEQQRNKLDYNTVRKNYAYFCEGVCQTIFQYALPFFKTTHNAAAFEAEYSDEQTFRDIFSLAGPAYDHSLPQVSRVRIEHLLGFYDKYTHIGNPKEISNVTDYFQSCAPVDVDLVPSLQLEFWPKDLEPFFKRIELNRPKLYQLIRCETSMHLIPKWSTKTPRCDRELEFRYSFSAAELILAQHRSSNEQVLNGIARSIYYKFLKGQKVSEQNVIPSYFIKTTVLWMCETMDLTMDNEETLAKKWLRYAIERLKERHCPHYFISDLNILEPFSNESLQKAVEILLNIDVNEIHEIQMFSISGQEHYRNKYNENLSYFLSKMKIKDLMNALRDYRQCNEQWISLDSQLPINDDEKDLTEVLTILNTLRALDGDYKNWRKFREIFLTQTASLPPIWGETVSVHNTFDFAQNFFCIGVILTFLNEHVLSNTLLASQSQPINLEEFQNYQNVIQQYLDPQTLFTSLQSMYSYFYNESVAGFERRRLTDHHPLGPTGQLQQKKSFPTFFIEVCLNALDSDSQLTLRELCQRSWSSLMTTDEQIALAIQMSIDDQNH